MTTFDNAPPITGWVVDPKDCPFPWCDHCRAYEARQSRTSAVEDETPHTRGEN